MGAPGILEATCADGVTRSRCQIRGKMKNRIWIKKDDIILLHLNEVGVHDAIVILKYTEEEVKKLKQAKELPEYMCIEIENIETREKLDDGFMVFNGKSLIYQFSFYKLIYLEKISSKLVNFNNYVKICKTLKIFR